MKRNRCFSERNRRGNGHHYISLTVSKFDIVFLQTCPHFTLLASLSFVCKSIDKTNVLISTKITCFSWTEWMCLRYIWQKYRYWRHIPGPSCGCPWGVAAGWAAVQPEVEPGAAAAALGREEGYGWTGRVQVEGIHQGWWGAGLIMQKATWYIPS